MIYHHSKRITPFVIWTNGRMGSSHLASVLNSHSRIRCFSEVFFDGNSVDYPYTGLFYKFGYNDKKKFLKNLYNGNFGGKLGKAIGFKLKYEHYDKNIFEYFKSIKSSLKVISLLRDPLRVKISQSKCKDLFNTYKDVNIGLNQSLEGFDRKVYLDPNSIVANLRKIKDRIKSSQQTIAEFEKMYVLYDDMVTKKQQLFNDILDFIGVDHEVLVSSCQKIMPFNLNECISNYEEICKVLKSSEFDYLIE